MCTLCQNNVTCFMEFPDLVCCRTRLRRPSLPGTSTARSLHMTTLKTRMETVRILSTRSARWRLKMGFLPLNKHNVILIQPRLLFAWQLYSTLLKSHYVLSLQPTFTGLALDFSAACCFYSDLFGSYGRFESWQTSTNSTIYWWDSAHQLSSGASVNEKLFVHKYYRWGKSTVNTFVGLGTIKEETTGALFPLPRTMLRCKPTSWGNYLSRNVQADKKKQGQPNWIKATLNLLSLSAYLLCSCECKAASYAASLLEEESG